MEFLKRILQKIKEYIHYIRYRDEFLRRSVLRKPIKITNLTQFSNDISSRDFLNGLSFTQKREVVDTMIENVITYDNQTNQQICKIENLFLQMEREFPQTFGVKGGY